MEAEENRLKSQNEQKHELASAWSLHFFQALDNRLEEALDKDVIDTSENL